MSTASETIRVVIPLTVRRRNGRPRILPPEGIDAAVDGTAPDPRPLRANRAVDGYDNPADHGSHGAMEMGEA